MWCNVAWYVLFKFSFEFLCNEGLAEDSKCLYSFMAGARCICFSETQFIRRLIVHDRKRSHILASTSYAGICITSNRYQYHNSTYHPSSTLIIFGADSFSFLLYFAPMNIKPAKQPVMWRTTIIFHTRNSTRSKRMVYSIRLNLLSWSNHSKHFWLRTQLRISIRIRH